jgi:hypothetical protein
MSPSARCYCFTVNNPDASSYPQFNEYLLKCLVYQLEQGESGTPHLQGYIEFTSRRTLSSAKSYPGLERAHLEIRRGSKTDAITYCVKDDGRLDGPWRFGDLESDSGKRNDLKQVADVVRDGASYDDVFEGYPQIVAKYPRYVEQLFERRRILELPPLQTFVPRDGWQSELFESLAETPSERQVFWFYDATGGTGKSYFAAQYPGSYIITGGKMADIYYAYRFERVVFFDWPRDAEDRVPYSAIESFKNGYFLSTKYEVKRVRFERPHVVVFSNFMPDTTKLSLDRWIINTI